MHVLDQLKKHGHRLTQPRQELIKVLESYPLTVQEVYDTLKKKRIKIDLASVYRTLELLIKMDIVRKVELGEGKRRYELIDKNHHHHHLICRNCGTIKDIKLKYEKNILQEAQQKSNFKIDSHSLEFFGTCADCK